MTAVGRLLAVVLVSATVVWSAPVARAQDDAEASRSPRVSGPLVGLPFDCEDNGPAGPGESKGQSCSWLYDLAPAESNLNEDFSAYWIQLEIDPGQQCAKQIGFKLSEPSGIRLVSASPDRGTKIKETTSTTTELTVDAEGAAPVPGGIAQDVQLGVGRVTATLKDGVFEYIWKGNSPDKVVVAIGIQFAHQGLPPDFSSSWSERVSFSMGSCKTLILRAQ